MKFSMIFICCFLEKNAINNDLIYCEMQGEQLCISIISMRICIFKSIYDIYLNNMNPTKVIKIKDAESIQETKL